MSEWQPIETAPMHVEIIGFRPQAHLTSDPPVCVSHRVSRPQTSPQGVKHYFDCWCHPTHWIPIPPLPVALHGEER